MRCHGERADDFVISIVRLYSRTQASFLPRHIIRSASSCAPVSSCRTRRFQHPVKYRSSSIGVYDELYGVPVDLCVWT
jgi:hypothetical protein